jgi:hypothetical protein
MDALPRDFMTPLALIARVEIAVPPRERAAGYVYAEPVAT